VKRRVVSEISSLTNPIAQNTITMNETKNPHAVALGKLGGSSKSEAKRRASRENGKKGGRPKKLAGRVDDRPEVRGLNGDREG
jgi:hypothetical protein